MKYYLYLTNKVNWIWFNIEIKYKKKKENIEMNKLFLVS